MTKDELLKAARGKPGAFDVGGLSLFLLPIPWGELKAMQAGHKAGDADTGEALTFAMIARAVCDEAGAPLLAAEDCAAFPLATIKALSDEIARRSGVGDVPGKA